MTKLIDIISKVLKNIGTLEVNEVLTTDVKVIDKTSVTSTQFKITYTV